MLHHSHGHTKSRQRAQTGAGNTIRLVRTQVKVSADSAGTLQLELVLELFDASAELVDLLDGDLRTQTTYVYMYMYVTSHKRRVTSSLLIQHKISLKALLFSRKQVSKILMTVLISQRRTFINFGKRIAMTLHA